MSFKLSPAERRALAQGCARADGKFSVARKTTLDNLVAMHLAKRAMVEGPPGSDPEPAAYNGIVTDYGCAAIGQRIRSNPLSDGAQALIGLGITGALFAALLYAMKPSN